MPRILKTKIKAVATNRRKRGGADEIANAAAKAVADVKITESVKTAIINTTNDVHDLTQAAKAVKHEFTPERIALATDALKTGKELLAKPEVQAAAKQAKAAATNLLHAAHDSQGVTQLATAAADLVKAHVSPKEAAIVDAQFQIGRELVGHAANLTGQTGSVPQTAQTAQPAGKPATQSTKTTSQPTVAPPPSSAESAPGEKTNASAPSKSSEAEPPAPAETTSKTDKSKSTVADTPIAAAAAAAELTTADPTKLTTTTFDKLIDKHMPPSVSAPLREDIKALTRVIIAFADGRTDELHNMMITRITANSCKLSFKGKEATEFYIQVTPPDKTVITVYESGVLRVTITFAKGKGVAAV